jgi:large subunit ribosomal protein L31e
MAEKKKEKTEQEYLIPLREKYRHVARYKKTPKAIKSVKEFIAKHMRIYDKDLNKIRLDKYVNEYLWARGIKNPPHEIRVKAIKDSEGIVKVELVNYPDKLKFKKLREEKVSKEAKEAIEKKKSLKERMQETMKGANKEDENKDGVEDKKEIEEKKESVKEAGEKMQKEMAKKEKHDTVDKKPVQKKKEHSKGDDKR